MVHPTDRRRWQVAWRGVAERGATPVAADGSSASGCGGRPRFLDGEDHHAAIILVAPVDQQHPSPRSEDEAQALPSSGEFGAQTGHLAQGSQAGTHAPSGIRRQRQDGDEPVQVLDRSPGAFDASHALQLVETDRVTRGGLTTADLGPIPGSIDRVEDRHDRVRVGVRVIDR
jgi:hypothetical protein